MDNTTNCPQCPRHCTADALSCGRGRAFFGQESSMQEDHEEHEHRGFDHPYSYGERGHHAKPDLETLEGLLSACGHTFHHGKGESVDFTALSLEEQLQLKTLLKTLLESWAPPV